MEKRKVTVMIGGQSCSFYSDDSDAYISALVQRANEVMRRTAAFSGVSSYTNAVLSVVFLTDALMRAETAKTVEEQREIKRPRKTTAQAVTEDKDQVSVWELLDDGNTAEN